MKEFAPYFAMVAGAVFLLGGSALAALFWAAKSGQLSNLEKGSKVIFDSAEPEGQVTDTFPGTEEKPSQNSLRGIKK